MPHHEYARSRRRCLALLLWLSLLLGAMAALAQDTGQICLQAYADVDGDGSRDETEGPISRGVAASLLNERGITIASQLLQDSAYAADGMLCFDGLLASEYQVVISSSEYQATTPTSARASVQPGAAPALIDFGAKGLVGEVVPDPVAIVGALDRAAQQTLLVAGLAAAGAIVGMSLLGVLVYLLLMRRRFRRRRSPRLKAAPLVPLAGAPPRPDETDDYLQPRQRLDPNRGSPPLFADDDTDLAGSS